MQALSVYSRGDHSQFLRMCKGIDLDVYPAIEKFIDPALRTKLEGNETIDLCIVKMVPDRLYFGVFEDDNHSPTRMLIFVPNRLRRRNLTCSPPPHRLVYAGGGPDGFTLFYLNEGERCVVTLEPTVHQKRAGVQGEQYIVHNVDGISCVFEPADVFRQGAHAWKTITVI